MDTVWCKRLCIYIHRRVLIRLGQMNRRNFVPPIALPFLYSFFSLLHIHTHTHPRARARAHTHERNVWKATPKSSNRPCVILTAFRNSLDTMRSIAAIVYASCYESSFPRAFHAYICTNMSSRRLDFAYLKRCVPLIQTSTLHGLFDRPCAWWNLNVHLRLKYIWTYTMENYVRLKMYTID